MEKKIKQLLKTVKLNENMLSLFFGVVTVILVGVLAMRMYSNQPTITSEGESSVASSSPVVKIGDVVVTETDDGEVYPAELPETYKVEAGDHLWKIAEKLYGSGYNWVDIAKENKLSNPGQIAVGQELSLPKVAVKITEDQKPVKAIETDSYTVAAGDTLWSIAVRAYADGYRYPEIAAANNLTNANVIEVGQVIKLPR